MNKTICKVWYFASDSNPGKEYETLLYNDGSLSCNCKGWCMKKKVDMNGQRSCRHTRLVEAGGADAQATRTINYQQPKIKLVTAKQTQIQPIGGLGVRKFVV